MGITEEQFHFMVESLTADIINHLVESEGYTLKQAIDTTYGSDLYAALNRPGTGLYNQSAGYLIEYLMREIKTGSLNPR